MRLSVIGERIQVRGRAMLERLEGIEKEDFSSAGARTEPRFEAHPLEAGRYALSFWGRFPPSWCGALSLSLSQVGLAVVQGFARKMHEKFWVAEFEIEPTRGDVHVESVDFLAMAGSSARAPGLRRLALSDFSVGDPARHGGAIYLEVHGRDQVGFLAELLGQLAFLTFFPEELIVQTTDGEVFDQFLLRGPAGQPASPGAAQALTRWLEGLKAA